MAFWKKMTALLVTGAMLLPSMPAIAWAAPEDSPTGSPDAYESPSEAPSRSVFAEGAEAPEAPALEDGEMRDECYGRPIDGLTETELGEMAAASNVELLADARGSEIPADQLSWISFIYIDGEPYKGGDIQVTEGDNFSYMLTWSPKPEMIPEDDQWGEGDWFEFTAFKVPGLNLARSTKANLVISGTKVGEWSTSYDPASGEMKYKAVFNRYIRYFDPTTVIAVLQGSGKFVDANTTGDIECGSDSGTVTIDPRPTVPPVPEVEGGTGWQPPKAPTFDDTVYAFGKGVKWTSGADMNMDPQIEWRVAFLERLQKIQREYAETKDPSVLVEEDGYCVIEDTLDANQRFYHSTDPEYGDSAPFFIELPVLAPGTGTIVNSPHGVGNVNSYDGPGIIDPIIKVDDHFTEIDGSAAYDPDAVSEVKKQVRNTPLTWAVTTDPATRRQTLTINVGKLGSKDSLNGLTWDMADVKHWPLQGLKDLIADCDRKIAAVIGGEESPITLLDKRTSILLNLLNNAAAMQDDPAASKAMVEEWNENYRTWRDNDAVGPLMPLKDKMGQLVVELPDADLAKAFEGWKVNNKGRTIAETGEYRDFIASLENIVADQDVYLAHRTEYGDSWEEAKRRYETALGFHEASKGIYGFVLKVRTESINTSMTKYSNSINVESGDKKWAANDEASVHFSSGIIGSYSLGDVVVQKADDLYDTGDVEADIQKVDADKAGLTGAQFQVYCSSDDAPEDLPELTAENRAHFFEKGASENGATYRYSHVAGSHPGDDPELGIVDTLEVSAADTGNEKKGRLALGGMTLFHDHWLVETKAPAGYYLDATPVRLKNDMDAVTYEMVPNVSRSVLLHKTDSFSDGPVAGAEFELFEKTGGREVPVVGFSAATVNGHETIWKTADDSGGVPLVTNAEGKLCIHGLDAGEYVLREKAPAPGYLTPADPMPEFAFTLSEELPAAEGDGAYDDAWHQVLNTPADPLENDPGVASLTVGKQGVGAAMLENAGFTLFRFTGTEEQWAQNPDNDELWKAVEPSTDGVEGKYFKTDHAIADVSIDESEGGMWAGDLKAVLTGADGWLCIEDIPVGHYSIAETKVPSPKYVRDFRSFYFTVDGTTVDSDVQLYTEPQQKNELKQNTLKNYQKKAQIALVKYDEAEGMPEIAGEQFDSGDGRESWRYTDEVLKPNEKGLEGAVYKLFMRRGATADWINPNPDQLKTEEILDYVSGFDTCVAVGKTDANGVLKLEDMKAKNGKAPDGLNPEEYYMIEITPPPGYLLDQEPVHFSLDEEVFEGVDENAPVGLVMASSNKKVDYGLRLMKVEASAAGEDGSVEGEQADSRGVAGAGFEVRQGDAPLEFAWDDASARYKRVQPGTPGATTTVFTDDDGELVVTGLEGGASYTLVETKVPQGYKQPEQPLSSEVTIPLTEGSGEGQGVFEKGILFPNEDVVVENERLEGKVTLYKRDTETREPLAGAKFGLYRTDVTPIEPGDPMYDPSNPDATRSEIVLVEEGVTGEDGTLTFDGLAWAPFYHVQEIEAPEGYLLDETKYSFSIDENSFDRAGDPIVVQFLITNSKGTLGEAMLQKVDADDHDIALEGAHFFLEKKMGPDAQGKEIWVGYGKGIYITDADGEIRFLLPPGDYRLTEMKAPDGYVNDAKMFGFTIEDAADQGIVTIDDGDGDGVITNRQGESGVFLKKTLGSIESDVSVAGATFQIGWEVAYPDFSTERVPLFFVPQGEGSYLYSPNAAAPGVTSELVTDERGYIYATMPAGFTYQGEGLASLACWETDAPDGLQIDSRTYPIGNLVEGIYSEVAVANSLTDEEQGKLAIDIHKTDGKSKLGLPGATFELRWAKDGDCSELPPVAVGTTDANGNLTFDATNATGLPGLVAGDTYHIVETDAPEGYVLDQTHHEVTFDETCFDENFAFTGIDVNVANYGVKASVQLKKVSADDFTKALPGAEFELLQYVADDGSGASGWEHYGEWRYTTGEDGVLHIDDVPYGTYKLVETAAPLGYLLDDPAWEREFSVDENVHGQTIDLGHVANEVDPNPTRDVHVKKVAAHDGSLGLPGAEFQLYVLGEDGEYRMVLTAPFVTDDAGEFTIEGLSVGTYALKEVKAPEGYEIAGQGLTPFDVRVEDRAVELMIENARSHSGGGQGSDTTVSVQKIWDGDDAARRPASVSVQLYRNGNAYGPAVELSEANGWSHAWEGLDPRFAWEVDEVDVPAGYEKTVSHEGHAWTIVNAAKPETGPVDPDEPGEPGGPDDPNEPGEPGGSEGPDGSGGSGDEGGQGEGSNGSDAAGDADGQKPGAHRGPDGGVAQTGDGMAVAVRAVCALLCVAGAVAAWAAYRMRRTRR